MRFSFKSSSSSSDGASGLAGKGCGSLFFGIFFLVGMFFVVILVGEAFRSIAPWFWTPTDCTIISSGVRETEDDEHPYNPRASFRYEFDGRTHHSTNFYRNYGGTSSYDRARDLAAPFAAGSTATCYVCPDQPALSVLARRFPWIVFTVFLPMIFVAIGAGGLWAVWRGSKSTPEERLTSISQQASGGRGPRAMILVGLLFTAIGGAVFLPLFALPVTRLALSMRWIATPCTIVSSGLRSWETDDGYSYRADVHYEYSAGGRTWRSNTVDFFSIVTTGRTDARAQRDRHPRGADRICFVHPSDPSKSVLERELRLKHLLGAIPLVFLIAGLALATHGWKALRGRGAAAQAILDEEPEDTRGEPITLEARTGPMGKVLGSLMFSVIWNGVVSVFLYQVVKSWQRDDPEWFLTFFLVPFVLVGLGSIVFVFYFLLATANPRPRITLLSGHPRLGDTIDFEWLLRGRASRVSSLKITLEGREEATYRRGTNTYTEKEPFSTRILVDTTNDWEIAHGTGRIEIPDDTMHTFSGDTNKIIWELKIEGVIKRWPDIDEALPITVKPLPVEAV